MPRSSSEPKIKIRTATAAAILSSANLPKSIASLVKADQKFVVHPHIASVKPTDPLLRGYLRQIYTARQPMGTDYPSAANFAGLASARSVKAATRDLADTLAVAMSRKNAKAGIVFGFIVELEDGSSAHGIIKADLEDEQRFHFVVGPGGAWTLGEVSEILPSPQGNWAKFAIAPQPNGTRAAGIRDITDNESAAEYFLEAVGLTVPKTTGTKAAVAQLALRHGHTMQEITVALDTLTKAVPTDEFVREHFPKVPESKATALLGKPVRPMNDVQPDDPFLRVWKTKSPHFELIADSSVIVDVNGRTVTVTLPPGSDSVEENIKP